MTTVKRLFDDFIPEHYSINLSLDHKKLRFDGTTVVRGKRRDAHGATVILHAKKLRIQSVTIAQQPCTFNIKKDTLCIDVPQGVVGKKSLNITICYSGVISTAMHGIYYSRSTTGDDVIATQFESHHAREAFPCIDEPAAKATFSVAITSSLPTVIGNMPMESKQANTVHLAKTPVMSTYLLAFVAGDFQRVSTTTSNGTEINVWSVKEHDIESLVFALEVAVKATEFLNDYFNVPYPLPKCDHVAIPDFSASVAAMENWGLITYKEDCLLADPDTISAASRERIAIIMAHEIAHQWFGNLVTMKWWDDLWLNESFATLMEYLIIDALYPDWNVMLGFASQEALNAARRDILPGVQSVAMPVNHPDEINTLFDPAIVYAKGACLLYMAYHLVGNVAFRKGLQHYFADHAYKNTTGSDLWRALGAASHIDVTTIMTTWLTQPGMPYIIVRELSDGSIQITQHQLLSDGSATKATWPIPLWPNQELEQSILENRTLTIQTSTEPLLLNTIGGHYAVQYDNPKTFEQFLVNVQKDTVSPTSRLLMLNDVLLLARCGVGSLVHALEALKVYSASTEEAVWEVIASVIGDCKMIIEGDTVAEANLRSFVYQCIEPHFARLGFEAQPDDTVNDKKLRTIICSLAVYTEEPNIISQALAHFTSIDNIETLPSDGRTAILTACVRFGPAETFNALFDLYPIIVNADIQAEIEAALCAAQKPEYIVKIIDSLKNPRFVRLQDLMSFVYYLLRNKESRSAIWEWLVNNWQWIHDSYKGDMSYDGIPRYASGAFSTTYWLDQYKTMFEPLVHDKALTRNIQMGVKDIESKIAWRDRDERAVNDWLLGATKSR